MKRVALVMFSLMLLVVGFAGCTAPAEVQSGETAEETVKATENAVEETAQPTEEAVEDVEAEEAVSKEITPFSAVDAETTKKWLDIPYADQSEAQKLDIMLPETGEGPYPVIISIHGGGYVEGDKTDPKIMSEGIHRGYGVVCVNYRLAGEATFPAAIYDVKAAVRFIKANAEEYNLDPERIAAWGESAGGHLASLLGTSSGVKELEDLEMGNAEQTSDVQVIVDFFGPVDFLTMNAQFEESGVDGIDHEKPNAVEAQFLGAPITEVPDMVAMADPTTYITEDDPPFFIEHGKMDKLVPYQQSVNFAAALSEVIGEEDVSLVLFDDGGHGTPKWFNTAENIDAIFAFLDHYLK